MDSLFYRDRSSQLDLLDCKKWEKTEHTLHGESKQRLMGRVLLVPTKVGASRFAHCSTSVSVLSPSLFTDSNFGSVNINQSKIPTGTKQRTPCRLLPGLSKEKKKKKKSICKPHKEFSGDRHQCLDSTWALWNMNPLLFTATCTSRKLPKQLENWS